MMRIHRGTSGRRTAARARAGRGGFTLMEMLTVMAVLAVVFGLSVGSLARSGKAGALESSSRVARSHLLRARLLSLSGGSLSRVEFRPADPEKNERASVTTEFTSQVGTWHFDDDEKGLFTLAGGGVRSKVFGGTFTSDGRLRGALELNPMTRVVSPPVEEAPTFDPRRGFLLRMDVFPASGGTVARFVPEKGEGEAFVLRIDDDGSLSAEIETIPDPVYEAQTKKDRRVKLKTAPAVIEMRQWSRVGFAYDGVTAEIFANGVSEATAEDARDVAVAPASCLIFGGYTGYLDEAEYFTTTAPERKEFEAGVDLESKAPLAVRFDRTGRLNENFHRAPFAVTLALEGRRETVSVDPSGIVR